MADRSRFVSRLYDRMAVVYDLAFGPLLQQGRVAALRQMALRPGDRVLEIGVGTGLSISLYPPDCQVIGIDLSKAMLAKAQEQIQTQRAWNVKVLAMDASQLAFPSDSFDIVYAPYVISVVGDPVAVAREMIRVCRPGGQLIFLNHFLSDRPWLAQLERWLSPWTRLVGFRADLDLAKFLRRTGLRPRSLEKVNWPPLWSLISCQKS